MSWGAVARYKGKEVDVQEIGRELRVQAILTGKVLQISDRLIIRMEFVDVENGWQYWGMQYNRKVSDLLAIQEDISWEVSERLRLKLSEEEKGRIIKRHTESPEAYQHYLKGLYFLNKRNLQWINRAIEHIEEALKIDPSYAKAYAALADCYSLCSCHSGLRPRDGFPKAKAAALKALSLDDSLAEAHASMALVRMLYDWDWTSAENEFKHAIALNPNYAMTHHWYSTFLARLARFEESLAEMKLAQTLDPLSLIITTNQGIVFYFMRNYDRALEYGNEALELDPNFGVAYGLLCAVHMQKEMYVEALEYCQIGLGLSKRDPEALGFLAMIYGKLGEKTKAYEVIDELKEHGQRKYVSPLYLGLAYIGVDEIEQALDCVQRACDERSHAVTYLKIAPFLDRLRSEPQFDELLKCVGLA
jgi:Tfp pilus assembly protein PilF